MDEDYSRLTPQERLDRICAILVRWIYRAEECRKKEASESKEPECSYNLTQAAQKIGVSKRTLQRWIKQRKYIPKQKHGRLYIITNQEVKDLQTIQATSSTNFAIIPL